MINKMLNSEWQIGSARYERVNKGPSPAALERLEDIREFYGAFDEHSQMLSGKEFARLLNDIAYLAAFCQTLFQEVSRLRRTEGADAKVAQQKEVEGEEPGTTTTDEVRANTTQPSNEDAGRGATSTGREVHPAAGSSELPAK